MSGGFHSPLVARAAERLRPALAKVSLARSGPAVHVDRLGAGRGRTADRRPARRAADGARCASRRPSAGYEGRRRDVRRDRAGPGARAVFCAAATARCRRSPSATRSRCASSRRRCPLPERLRVARGQGRARHRGIARHRRGHLARARAAPALAWRSTTASGQEAAEAIASEVGGIALPADVVDPEEAKELIERVEWELGDIDILVNNAGITRDTLIARMSDDDWERGDRHQPPRHVQHLPRGGAEDDAPPLRGRS